MNGPTGSARLPQAWHSSLRESHAAAGSASALEVRYLQWMGQYGGGMVERILRSYEARPVVVLYLEDMSTKEIAETLAISENNVAVRLTRARAALSQRLGEKR